MDVDRTTISDSTKPYIMLERRKSNIFPVIMEYTSRPSVPTTCDRTSSRRPRTTDVDLPTFPLTKNWTGWTLCCASQGPGWTKLLVPLNAAAALVAGANSATTASLTSLQLMMGWCLSVQSWRSTSAKKFPARVPAVETWKETFEETREAESALLSSCFSAPLDASNQTSRRDPLKIVQKAARSDPLTRFQKTATRPASRPKAESCCLQKGPQGR